MRKLPLSNTAGRGEIPALIFFKNLLLTRFEILKAWASEHSTMLCTTKMKTTLREAASRAATYNAMLKVSIKYAEEHGLSEIRISVARAKQFYNDLVILEKALVQPTPRQSSVGFDRLDEIFFRQANVLNETINKVMA